jgi:DNA-directed RNA polymerase specialized sigma24 family protein
MKKKSDEGGRKQKSESELKFERELLEKLLQQDDQARGQFYNLYYHRIEYAVLAKVKNAEDARDITADVFLRLYKILAKGKQFEKLIDVVGYLYMIAFNLSKKFLKKNSRTTFSGKI